MFTVGEVINTYGYLVGKTRAEMFVNTAVWCHSIVPDANKKSSIAHGTSSPDENLTKQPLSVPLPQTLPVGSKNLKRTKSIADIPTSVC